MGIEMRVRLTFRDEILGTVPRSKEVYASYIADKKGTLQHEDPLTKEELAQELATVTDDLEKKGWTTFHKLPDGTPVLYDYVCKGFFKDACGMLRRCKGTLSGKLRAYKKEIDGLVFIAPRQIPLVIPEGKKMGVNERPLRASTPQGDRVALARSDTCPRGTTLEFTITVLGGNIDEAQLKEWFDYGRYRGLGQWRNASFGTFSYEIMQ